MNKGKLLEIFNEVLEKFEDSESYCIQDFQTDDNDYSLKDLKNDIKEYRRSFEKALNEKTE